MFPWEQLLTSNRSIAVTKLAQFYHRPGTYLGDRNCVDRLKVKKSVRVWMSIFKEKKSCIFIETNGFSFAFTHPGKFVLSEMPELLQLI